MFESLDFGKMIDDAERQVDLEFFEMWVATHPMPTSPEVKRECEPEIKKFETLLSDFEIKHPVDDLYSITDLTVADAQKHPTREPAKLDLPPILKQLQLIKEETDVSPERYVELESSWKRISNAVGFINNGKVVHDR
jgi:hypothetical protein